MSKTIDSVWAEEAGFQLVVERDGAGPVRVSVVEFASGAYSSQRAALTIAPYRWDRIVRAMETAAHVSFDEGEAK